MIKSRLLAVSHSLIVFLSIILIAYLNFAIIRYWFSGEFNQNLSSIEISYIQMAKFWSEGGIAGPGWQPLWYLGYPWHVFYTPLLPFLELLANKTLVWSFAHAYRVITASAYILSPVTLFFFVWQISKSKSGALVASFFYSFVPSTIGFLFAGVREDVFTAHAEPRRFAILVRWGEGPHILGLVFLPLFGVFASRYFERRGLRNLFLSAFFLAIVALTNAVALWGTILLYLALFLSELTKKSAEPIALIKNSVSVGLLCFGLIGFWYNLPFISTFFREGGGAFTNWLSLVPWRAIILLLVCFGLFLVVKKLFGRFSGINFAIFWFLMLFGIVYVYYTSGELRLEFAPQALRLTTEVDMALSVLAGVVISNIFLLLAAVKSKIRFAGYPAAAAVFAVPVVVILVWYRSLGDMAPFAKPLNQTKVGDITNTAEYRVAERLKKETAGTNQRVLAPGNYGFWLNWFSDVPQLRGALYQSSTHFWPDHIYWQLTNGSDPEIALAWLKIANIGKVVYTTDGSQEIYKDYKVGQAKFEAILKPIEQEKGDVYYDVPLAVDSLAKIVQKDSILAIAKPKNAIDSEPVFAYVAELERFAQKKASLTTVNGGHLKISGELLPGQAILVQSTYDGGWRVRSKVNQGESGGIRGWKTLRDPMDFMVIVPSFAKVFDPEDSDRRALEGKPVNFEIELIYGRPLTVWLGYLVTAATLAWIVNKTYKTYRSHKS